MAYDRINWENAPSTLTPLNAENLNAMDAAIANMDVLVESANNLIEQLESAVALLEARMDTFVSLPDGSTAGNAEIIDARTLANNETYTSLGLAMRAMAVSRRGTATGSSVENDTANNIASGLNSHAEGMHTSTDGTASHAEGSWSVASGLAAHAEGSHTIANHAMQHALGAYNVGDPSSETATNKGNYIEIVGNGTADNARSNARTLDWNGNEVLSGKLTVGLDPTNDLDVTTRRYVNGLIRSGVGMKSTISNMGSEANGNYSHAEGNETTANGASAHAEGNGTKAEGDNTHAEGNHTTARFNSSHAEGTWTEASGIAAHAEGEGVMAMSNHQHAFGKYNVADNNGNYVEIVGNGASSQAKSNARVLDWNGNEKLAGSLTLGMDTEDEVTITPEMASGMHAVAVEGTKLIIGGYSNGQDDGNP